MNRYTSAGIKFDVDIKEAYKQLESMGTSTEKILDGMKLHTQQFNEQWTDMTRGIKDTKRIVSGIVISRGFYTLLGAISSSTKDILNFSKNLETATMSMEYFTTGADKAAKALAYLREMNLLAAKTPFSLEPILGMTRYAQAVGMASGATQDFIRVIADTAAATGASEDAMQRMTVALGQVQAKGRLTGRELRQLAHAGIPVYQILNEQLGLTQHQIADIGKYWISADKAVTSILKGLEQRYEGAADRMADTVVGMTNIIKDNTRMIGQLATSALYDKYSETLGKIRDAVVRYREIAMDKGPANMVKQMLLDLDPSGEVGTKILLLVGNLRQLSLSLKQLYISSAPIRKMFMDSLNVSITVASRTLKQFADITAWTSEKLNVLGIRGITVAEAIASLYITYKAASWLAFLGQGAIAAANTVVVLGQSIASLLPAAVQANIGFTTLTAGALGFIASGLAVIGVFKAISGIMGGLDTTATGLNVLPDSYMEPLKEIERQWQEYNEQIAQYQEDYKLPYEELTAGADDAVDGFEDIMDASKRAAKAVKNDWLASFDEVYAIPKDAANALDDMDKLDFGTFLQGPQFKFPKFESLKIEVPKLNMGDIFKDPNTNPFKQPDKDWWRKMLINLLPLAMLQAIRANFKRRRDGDGRDTASPGSGPGPSTPDALLNLSDKELQKLYKQAIDKLTDQEKVLEEIIKQIKDPATPKGVRDTLREMLSEQIKAIDKNVEATNRIMVARGERKIIGSEAVEAARGVYVDETLKNLTLVMDDLYRRLGGDITKAEAEAILKQIEGVKKEIAKVATQSENNIGAWVDSLRESHGQLTDAFIKYPGLATEEFLQLVSDFQEQWKTAEKIMIALDKTPEGISADMQIIANTAEDTKQLITLLKKMIANEAELMRDRERLTYYLEDAVEHADEIKTMDKSMDHLAREIQRLSRDARAIVDRLKIDDLELREERAHDRSVRLEKERAKREAEMAKRERELKEREKALHERTERAQAVEEQRQALERSEYENRRAAMEQRRLAEEEIEAQRRLEEVRRQQEDYQALQELQNQTHQSIVDSWADYNELQQLSLDTTNIIQEYYKRIAKGDETYLEYYEEALQNFPKVGEGWAYAFTRSDTADLTYLLEKAEEVGLYVRDGIDSVLLDFIEFGSSLRDETIQAKIALHKLIEVSTQQGLYDPLEHLLNDIYTTFKHIDISGLYQTGTNLENLPPLLAAFAEDFSDAMRYLNASGTKIRALVEGMSGFTNIVEMAANDFGRVADSHDIVNFLKNFTSRQIDPKLEIARATGVLLEDIVKYVVGVLDPKQLEDLGIEAIFQGQTITGLEGALATQIDTLGKMFDDLGGELLGIDVKTVGQKIFDVYEQGSNVMMETLYERTRDWYYQLAAQSYLLSRGEGGPMGIMLFNRDFDYGDEIAQKFHEAFKIGLRGDVFSIDTIQKVLGKDFSETALEAYRTKLFNTVFFDPRKGTIDLSPLKQATRTYITQFTKEMFEAIDFPGITQTWQDYLNLLLEASQLDGFEQYIRSYVMFDTHLGTISKDIALAAVPRSYANITSNFNKWIQTIFDDKKVKVNYKNIEMVLGEQYKELHGSLINNIQKAITDLNVDGNINRFTETIDVAITHLKDSLTTYREGFDTSITAITQTETTITALERLLEIPHTVESAGRQLRLAIEKIADVNIKITEGLEVTHDELFMLTKTLRNVKRDLDLNFTDVIDGVVSHLQNLQIRIKDTEGILSLDDIIQTPWQVANIQDTLALTEQYIRTKMNPTVTSLRDEFAELRKSASKIFIDLEATGLDTDVAIPVQIGMYDYLREIPYEKFFNYGEKLNRENLAIMRQMTDTTTKIYREAEQIHGQIKEILQKDSGTSIEAELRRIISISTANEDRTKAAQALLDIANKYTSIDEEAIFKKAFEELAISDIARNFEKIPASILDAGGTVAEIGKDIVDMIGNATAEFIGHNIASYDIPLLKRLYPDIDFSLIYDTYEEFNNLISDNTKAFSGFTKSLSNLYTAITGQESIGAHDAAVDVSMNKVLYDFLQRNDIERMIDTMVEVAKETTVNGKVTNEIFRKVVEGFDTNIDATKIAKDVASIKEAAKSMDSSLASVLRRVYTGGYDTEQVITDGVPKLNFQGREVVDAYTGINDLITDLNIALSSVTPKVDRSFIEAGKWLLEMANTISASQQEIINVADYARNTINIDWSKVLGGDDTMLGFGLYFDWEEIMKGFGINFTDFMNKKGFFDDTAWGKQWNTFKANLQEKVNKGLGKGLAELMDSPFLQKFDFLNFINTMTTGKGWTMPGAADVEGVTEYFKTIPIDSFLQSLIGKVPDETLFELMRQATTEYNLGPLQFRGGLEHIYGSVDFEKTLDITLGNWIRKYSLGGTKYTETGAGYSELIGSTFQVDLGKAAQALKTIGTGLQVLSIAGTAWGEISGMTQAISAWDKAGVYDPLVGTGDKLAGDIRAMYDPMIKAATLGAKYALVPVTGGLSLLTPTDMFDTQSGIRNLMKEYENLTPEARELFGQKYISSDKTAGTTGIFWDIFKAGNPFMSEVQRILRYDVDNLLGQTTAATYYGGIEHAVSSKITSKNVLEYIDKQFEAWDDGIMTDWMKVVDYFMMSGDTTSKQAKKFYKLIGEEGLEKIKLGYGLDIDYIEAVDTLLAFAGDEINQALQLAGINAISSGAELDLSLKPYFDSIFEPIHADFKRGIFGQLEIQDMFDNVAAVFDKSQFEGISFSVVEEALNSIGARIEDASKGLSAITFDGADLYDNIIGWTEQIPEHIGLSTMTLSPDEVQILAQAGIQVNGDGTVTFMKAMNENVSGAERKIDLTFDDLSESVKESLAAAKITLDFDTQLLKMDIDKMSSQVEKAMFSLGRSFAGQVSQEAEEALAGLGRVLDSGYFEITNKAVLSGQMTITEFIAGLGGKAKAVQPEILNALRLIDASIDEGGARTQANIAKMADGIVIPSPLKPEQMNAEIEAAFASIGATFIREGNELFMVINKPGEQWKDGISVIPKEAWAKVSDETVAALRKLGVTITEGVADVTVDISTAFNKGFQEADFTPAIADALNAIGVAFEFENGKLANVISTGMGELIDGVLTLPKGMITQVTPEVQAALEGIGVVFKRDGEKMMIDFAKVNETGIGNIIELYANRPDLWDNIPNSVLGYLEQAGFYADGEMLRIQANMLEHMIQIGDDWVGNWSLFPPEVAQALGLTTDEVAKGFAQVNWAAQDAKVGDIIDGAIVVPFKDLPDSVKQSLVGPGGVTASMANSKVLLRNTTEDTFNAMVTAVREAFGEAAREASSGATDIANAVARAISDANRMNNIKVGSTVTTPGFLGIGKKTEANTLGSPIAIGNDTFYVEYDPSGKVVRVIKYDTRTGKQATVDPYANGNLLAELRKRAPGFASGGLIETDGLYRAGEFGRIETVLPLENKKSMRLVGTAIADQLPLENLGVLNAVHEAFSQTFSPKLFEPLYAAVGRQNAGIAYSGRAASLQDTENVVESVTRKVLEAVLPAMSTTQYAADEDTRRPLYVGTLVADERGLKELNKKMKIIEEMEDHRRGY